MAQASSAQREPSMEEILASIRRIIEDNDAAERGRTAPVESAETDQVRRKVIDVDAFRNETRAQPSGYPEPAPVIEPQGESAHVSETQVSETQAAAESIASEPRWVETPQEEKLTVQSTAPDRRQDLAAAIENSRAAREDARALLGIPEPANTALPPETAHPAESAPQPENEALNASILETLFQNRTRVDVRNAPPAAESAGAKPALISEHAERKVAASFAELSDAFAELSEAFAERSRKKFDEMAERMIAPLLREWMEDNLPAIVERMVREEIERVARGSQ